MRSSGKRFSGLPFFDDTDVPDLSEETAWKTRGTNAPGAATPSTRLDTLEVMGIDRPLIFPQVIMAIPAWRGDDFGTRVRAAFNDAVVRWTEEGQGRLRPTALLATHDLAVAIDEAAAVSPASAEADPLWALLSETDTPVLLHIGGQQGFFGSEAWDKAPSLAPGAPGKGEPVGPHMLATMHFAAMNYLTTMIFGGVFERHPTLRFGVIELGAHWVGPFADLLDDRVGRSGRLRKLLSRKPSETLAANVRVTPFYFEHIGRQIERYGLPEVYAFATDFPHPEGGTDPIGAIHDEVAPLGADVVEQVFVTNAELLLPA